MPAILCKCKNRISIGEIPSKNVFLIISEEKFVNLPESIDVPLLRGFMQTVIKCAHCSRIWVYWDGLIENPACYLPDNLTDLDRQ